MPKFMVHGSYTAEGLQGLLKDGGTGRRKAVEAALDALGGHLDSFYFAFGDADVVAIVDVPDNVTAATIAIGIASTGSAHLKTYVLMTPEEVDEATKKTLSYRAPGR